MDELCRMCGKPRNEHYGAIESCFGPMDERGGFYAPAVDALRAENARLRSLVDGAFEVVELWGHATVHNGQIEWAQSWLTSARAALSCQAPEAKGAPHSKSEQRRVTIQQEAKGESGEEQPAMSPHDIIHDLIAVCADQLQFLRNHAQGFGSQLTPDRDADVCALLDHASKFLSYRLPLLIARKPAKEQKI